MAAYTGSGAEKLAYKGVLSTSQGFVTGEIPAIPGLTAYGMSMTEVKETLQGLLEEHIEELLDNDDVLPQDVPVSGSESASKQTDLFYIVVPSTARKSTTFCDLGDILDRPHRALQFKAVVLQDSGMMHAYFPDLTGGFTSGCSISEVQTKLQTLLETYVGLTLRAGEDLPPAKFAQVSELEMTTEELAKTPVVGLPTFTVNIPL